MVNNHEGKEDKDLGYEIHEHLQHQDRDVQGGQCSVFVVVTEDQRESNYIIQNFIVEPDFDDRKGDGYEGEDNRK